jgi:hypothetical protein
MRIKLLRKKSSDQYIISTAPPATYLYSDSKFRYNDFQYESFLVNRISAKILHNSPRLLFSTEINVQTPVYMMKGLKHFSVQFAAEILNYF